MFICFGMKNIFLYMSWLCMLTMVSAQENVWLTGQLISEDSTGIDRVNVLNMTQSNGTTTNTDGIFEIPVQIGDTLLFSAIQFQNIQIYITDKHIDNPFITQIMVLDEVTLQDVVLTDFSMFDTNHTAGEVDMSLPFNTTPIVRPYTTRKAAYLQGGIISSIVNRLNGKIKKNKEIQAYERERALVEEARGIFEDKFYTELGIPQDEIYLFIDFYMEDAKAKGYLKPDFKYELISHIKNNVPLYLQFRERVIDSVFVKP